MAMASASQPVWATKSDGLVGVGQQLLAGQLALGADAVLLARLTGLERAEDPELALDGDADGVCHVATRG